MADVLAGPPRAMPPVELVELVGPMFAKVKLPRPKLFWLLLTLVLLLLLPLVVEELVEVLSATFEVLALRPLEFKALFGVRLLALPELRVGLA